MFLLNLTSSSCEVCFANATVLFLRIKKITRTFYKNSSLNHLNSSKNFCYIYTGQLMLGTHILELYLLCESAENRKLMHLVQLLCWLAFFWLRVLFCLLQYVLKRTESNGDLH